MSLLSSAVECLQLNSFSINTRKVIRLFWLFCYKNVAYAICGRCVSKMKPNLGESNGKTFLCNKKGEESWQISILLFEGK